MGAERLREVKVPEGVEPKGPHGERVIVCNPTWINWKPKTYYSDETDEAILQTILWTWFAVYQDKHTGKIHAFTYQEEAILQRWDPEVQKEEQEDAEDGPDIGASLEDFQSRGLIDPAPGTEGSVYAPGESLKGRAPD